MSTSSPAAAKKPLSTANAGRRTPNSNSASTTGPPSRSPSRLAASTSTTSAVSTTSSTTAPTSTGNPATTATTNGLNRARSIRNGAPVSARAAVRKPAGSSTSTASTLSGASGTSLSPTDAAAAAAADEDARAEMQARVDELQQRLQAAERQQSEAARQATVLQVKLDEAHKEQGLLEESVHEHTERIEELENEKKESLRARREMEQIYESERAAAMKEKEDAGVREEEMQAAMQRLKESLAQRELRGGLGGGGTGGGGGAGGGGGGGSALVDDDTLRPSPSRQSSFRASNNGSPAPETPDRQFAPSSVHRSDSSSRSNSKLVMQKDKIIESLRLELAEAQIKLVEVENMGGGRMQEQQKQIYDLKMQNARLMEENESFQLLLSEKTLNGDFLRPPSRSHSRPPSSRIREPGESSSGSGGGTSLADELEAHGDVEGGEEDRRLQGEVNSLKDQNKALTLYINNIISRLLQHEQFEQILDKTPDLIAGPNAASRKYFEDRDKELPPPPSDRDDKSGDEQPTGFLQRAKSVMGGKRARPLSQIQGDQSLYPPKSEDGHTVHENPETAPSVPLGRSRSVRNTSGHRRVNSEWSAANVVTNMYRGPSTGVGGGPLSPGLSSPTQRNSFFAGQFPRQMSLGSPVPTISGLAAAGAGAPASDKERALPQRDSKLSSSHSNRNSITSNPAASSGTGIDTVGLEHGANSSSSSDPVSASASSSSDRPTPASPPRSIASSTGGDRDMKSSGAIMMGSRMRPLRLVQEAGPDGQQQQQQHQQQAQSLLQSQAGNRGSWFGWMNKGTAAALGGATGSSTTSGSAQ